MGVSTAHLLTTAGARRSRGQALAGGEFGNQVSLGFDERRTLRLHLAGGQRSDHCLGRELAQLHARGCLLVGAAGRSRVFHVAQGALGVEDLFAFAAWAAKACVEMHRPKAKTGTMAKEIRMRFPPGN